MIRYPRVKTILLVIVLIAFIGGVPSQIFGQVSGVAQSFSQYFSPQILKAMDAMMKTTLDCQPDGYWKIWTYGFHRKYKGPKRKFEVILNWDGMYYIKDASAFPFEVEIVGDWTLLK